MGYAQTYRPLFFKDVIGQDKVVGTLQNMLLEKKPGTAYIFSGNRGTGKTTVARILAKAVNCAEGINKEPCNECPSCTWINNGCSMDLVELDAATNRGIDSVRELNQYVQFSSSGNYRIILLDEAHMMTKEAFNALLKTLEEPPSHIMFILATTEIAKIPTTIQSRCHVMTFYDLSPADCLKIISKVIKEENIKIDKDAAVALARKTDGSARDALNALEQLHFFKPEGITEDDVEEYLSGWNIDVPFNIIDAVKNRNIEKIYSSLADYFKSGGNARQLFKDMLRLLRSIFIVRACPNAYQQILNPTPKQEKLFKRLAEQWETWELYAAMESLVKYITIFEFGMDERVVVELAIFDAFSGDLDELNRW